MQAILIRLLCLGCAAPAIFLTGCISNKYRSASATDEPAVRMAVELAAAPVQTRLETVIVYQGPGSWKKSAYWDEFTVTFTNPSAETATLIAATLVDYAGTSAPAGDDPWQLEKASQSQQDRYRRAGVSFVLHTLGYTAATYGAVGAGFMAGAAVTSTWGGAIAGATVGLVAVPVAAVVILVNNQNHKHQIEKVFARRRLTLPLNLGPGASVTGSFFFPMTVSPQALRLEWSRGGGFVTVALPLSMLAGMHLPEPERKSAQ